MTQEHEPGPTPAGPPGRSGWRLIGADVATSEPRDGATNMAVDRALLEAVADGGTPVVRFYRWSPATLSFGRNQPARGLYDPEAAADRGIDFVRRPTGGQAVLHDDELTYAVVAPVEQVGRPRTAYRTINEALVRGLRAVGVPAEVAGLGLAGAGSADGGAAGASGPGRSWTEACFRRPERGEVVAGGRKLVGSAQRTERRIILQHGSILLGGSQAPAEELLREAPAGFAGSGPGPGPGWTTVESELGRRVDLAALASALAAGMEAVLGISLAPSGLTPTEAAAATRLQRRFASWEWTWRR